MPVFLNIAPDLGVRVRSALVIVGIAALVVTLGDWWFALSLFFVLAIMAFEWIKLCRAHHVGFALVIVMSAACVILFDIMGYDSLVLPSIGFWMLVQLMVRSHYQTEDIRLLMLGNILLSVGAWSALTLMALHPSPWLFVWLIFVVSSSDIGAYFTGRMIGGPRLAPKISPGKTWAGFVGAMVFAGIVGASFSAIGHGHVALGFALGVLLGAVGQFSDLMVSVLKRRVHIKDTGTIIAGHGGILDRVDSLLLTLPLFAIVCVFLYIPPL